MKIKLGVRTKIAISAVASMSIGVTVFLLVMVPLVKDRLVTDAVLHFETETELYSDIVSAQIENVQAGLSTLVNTPPIQGIIRARDNNGYDTLEQSTYEQWTERPQDIFVSAADSEKIYYQLRYLDKNGQELVRVNYNNGETTVVTGEDLQNKSNRDYFKEAIRPEILMRLSRQALRPVVMTFAQM